MKNEEIAKKLGNLAQLYEQLKALRASQGEEFSTEDEELLSRAELLLEALKNYMYQFGMSIYRTKKGKRFFKKFIHDEDEVRGFDELDTHCFEFQENEPSFLQRLLEYKPADRILMNDTVENVVAQLYEKDPQMVEIFDELLEEEKQRCIEIIKEGQLDIDIEKTFEIQNEITTPEIKIELDAPAIDITDIEQDIVREFDSEEYTPETIEEEFEEEYISQPQSRKKSRSSKGGKAPKQARVNNLMQESYDCGTATVEKKKKSNRAKENIAPEISKDNTNSR
ncbi:MAG: hypothetical protein IJZ59_02175 [Alphaproteobacteria bacterium]|nr:hypothetical protein [Alphaproteobacteria bacterium]